MTKPLVSICIPAYNGAAYLQECLDSCLAQTFNDFEIIICDDGSTDETINIIESYDHSKIKFFKNNVNLGLVGNWNKCIELASGDWIKFVFQDDFIAKNCLQEFVNKIDEQTVLMVSQRDFILPKNAPDDVKNYYNNEVRTLENTVSEKRELFSPALISKIAVQNICMNFIGEPSLIFFKRSCVNESGLFNSALKQICDLEFALRIACKYGLKYIPKKICSFRVHQNSTTNSNLKDKYFQLHYIEPLLFSYFLLFDKHFESLRNALNFFQLQKLKLYFKVKAHNAYSVNCKEDRQHYLFEASTKDFVEIKKHQKGSLLVRLIAARLK